MGFQLVLSCADVRVRSVAVEETAVILGSSVGCALEAASPAIADRQGVFAANAEGLSYRSIASPSGTRIRRRGGEEEERLGTREAQTLAAGDRLLIGEGIDRLSVEVVQVDDDAEGPSLDLGESSPSDQAVVKATRPLDAVALFDLQLREEDPGALTVLYRMTRALHSSMRRSELMHSVAERVMQAFPSCTHVSLMVPAKDTPSGLEVVCALRRAEEEEEGEAAKTSETVLAAAVRGRTAVLFAQARAMLPESESVMLADIRSTICVPLFHDDVLVGALQTDIRGTDGAFEERDLEILTVFGEQLASALVSADLRDRLEQAEAALRRDNRALRDHLEQVLRSESEAMRSMYRQIQMAVREEAPVVIIGETGAGKELVAQTIHRRSRRSDGPWVPENCGAIPRELVEAHLFGHARGGFTGAVEARKGLFVQADGGTLFLDEIGELPLELQPTLLRVLETGQVRPVGSDRMVEVNVRVICATHRDLKKEVEAGRFRADLYFRLDVLRVQVPALRDRPEDIAPFAEHFLEMYEESSHRKLGGISSEAMAILISHSWPGNVRELKNAMDRAAMATEDGEEIVPAVLGDELGVQGSEPDGESGLLLGAVEALERRLIASALRRFNGNISHTSTFLGLSRPGLRSRMERYGLEKPDKDEKDDEDDGEKTS